jgi:CelD/BcsL family acetyltransferase involved in cellulose biosynthesis
MMDIISDATRFAELKPEWDELVAVGSANPFLTHAWLRAWWEHLGGSRRLAILAIRTGGQLVAAAPLSLSRARVPWFWRYEFLGTGQAGSDYLDVVSRPGHEAESIRALEAYARVQRRAIHLEHLPAGSLASRMTGPLTESGWSVRETANGVCPFIRLQEHTWDSYLATLGPSHRANVRRRLRTLESRFGMRFETVASEERRAEALEALFAFHAGRFGKHGSTAFHTPALRAFHHDVTRRSMHEGWLRLFTMSLDGRIAAVMYGFSHGGRFYFYQHGFDEQYRQHSVGLALMGLTILAAIEEGLSEFDMLFGDEAYKSFWARERRSLVRVDLFPPHLAGRIHHGSVEAERTMRTLARRVLSRTAHAS